MIHLDFTWGALFAVGLGWSLGGITGNVLVSLVSAYRRVRRVRRRRRIVSI